MGVSQADREHSTIGCEVIQCCDAVVTLITLYHVFPDLLMYWLVEPLVEKGEYYPKGGMRRLVCCHTPSDIACYYTLHRRRVCSG